MGILIFSDRILGVVGHTEMVIRVKLAMKRRLEYRLLSSQPTAVQQIFCIVRFSNTRYMLFRFCEILVCRPNMFSFMRICGEYLKWNQAFFCCSLERSLGFDWWILRGHKIQIADLGEYLALYCGRKPSIIIRTWK